MRKNRMARQGRSEGDERGHENDSVPPKDGEGKSSQQPITVTVVPEHEDVAESAADHLLPLTIRAKDVLQEVDRICRHPAFASAPNLQAFLRFTVRLALEGKTQDLKEYTIAVSVFGRREDFDPREASIVRTQAGKLRAKLQDYYNGEGFDAPVYIVFRPGSYVPSFEAVHPSQRLAPGTQTIMPSKAWAPSVAILPAQVASDEDVLQEAARYFHECLYSALSVERDVRLVMRTILSAALLRNNDHSKIAHQVNAQYIIEFSVSKGERIRFNLRILNSSDGLSHWATVLTVAQDDLHAGVELIAGSVCKQIVEQILRTKEMKPRRVYQESSPVHRACVEGNYLCDRLNERSLQRASDCFWRALGKDEQFAPAHAGLSKFHLHRFLLESASASEAWPASKAAALRALACDPDLPDAQASLASVRAAFEWNFQQAATRFAKILAVKPDESGILVSQALYTAIPCGELDAAAEQIQKAVDLTPMSTMARWALGLAHYHTRRFDDAEQILSQLHELDPASLLVSSSLWKTYVAKGDLRSAERVQNSMSAAAPQSVFNLVCKACAEAWNGDVESAGNALEQIELLSPQQHVSRLHPAQIYLALGDHRNAMFCIEQGVKERAAGCLWLRTDPIWDPLRDSERFSRILAGLDG